MTENQVNEYNAEVSRLQTENKWLQGLIASSDIVRENSCKSIERLHAEVAAMRQALQWLKSISFSREDDLVEWPGKETREEIDRALSTTAGAAMLRVVEAARQSNCVVLMCVDCEHTGDCQLKPIIAALAEMDGDK
jgi:hypothetical protein